MWWKLEQKYPISNTAELYLLYCSYVLEMKPSDEALWT